MTDTLTMTPRTRVRRIKERANYTVAAICEALDEAMMATIAFSDGVSTHAIPTASWRVGDYLYIHGSNGSRLIKQLLTGQQACVSVTNMHGLVLARTAFHHSMNYSSVCIYGVFERVSDDEKESAMQQFFEHWLPGRWTHVRKPNQQELAATTFLRIAITEAVLKSRQGPPKDDLEDMQQPVWAGVIPMQLQWLASVQVDEQQHAELPGDSVRDLLLDE